MRLSRVTPAVADHPKLCSFTCAACGEVLTTDAPPGPAE
jgi:hypothetical protein